MQETFHSENHDKHSSSRKRRRRSRSRSHDKNKELRIQMKPLILSSDNELTRQNEISYIEGSNFTQKNFSSSRKQDTLINPDSHPRLQGGQYTSMISERAHEAAIFGHSSVPLPSILGTDPAEGKDKLVSSVDTVKQLLHHSLDKSNLSTVWDAWLIKLSELKTQRANNISSTMNANQRKRINGIG
ncbi:hypothetical protein EWB00_003425 [Schistosoma japonicum]|uniref:SJCHGC02386 protein n=1 Tax=Schistosoma japonicum TaxID=6182 RepID=Q5DEQ0_SCHJA|nr:SJCHGC02386 protein [Schistosoma japonicum]TNN20707.1 hypothetical protein EWB00_003425 [Schistosoma japonicum]